MDEHNTNLISEIAKKLGSRGGQKTAERGSDYFRDLQKKSVKAKLRKKKRSRV
jgi:hypothetical protein